MLVVAILIIHFVGFVSFALAEPFSDRAFFVRWEDSGLNNPLMGVHFSDARTGWAVGYYGRIVATRDGGTTWAPQTSGTRLSLYGVHFADARTGWAVGASGTILATRDGGTTWLPQTSGTKTDLRTVHFADARTGWAVGNDGTILATRDGGTTWAPQTSGTGAPLFGVHFAGARTGWAVGDDGTILATRDGGTTWVPQTSETGAPLLGVHFAGARTGWVVGAGGTMLRSAPPNYDPLVSDVNAVTNNQGRLDVSFQLKSDSAVLRALIFARVREANWTSIGAAEKSGAGDGRWHLSWTPQRIARPGDQIEYQVQVDDGGPPFAATRGGRRPGARTGQL
jgi:photosystem II stability/assembly factor-like uncharacterized protein